MLDRLAHEDPLSRAAQPPRLHARARQLIAREQRYGDQAAMLFVDIDGLKEINDSFGHGAGDEALIQVARLLDPGVRKSDCVARLGGDEFGILLEHADEASARETAVRLRSKCRSANSAATAIGCRSASPSALTMIEPGDEPEAVIGRADQAMYRAEGRRPRRGARSDNRSRWTGEVVVQLVDQRLAGRDLDPDDVVVADVRQMLDQRADANCRGRRSAPAGPTRSAGAIAASQ